MNYEKTWDEELSSKGRCKINQAKRQNWGELNPVTRNPESSKASNRKESQAWKRELPPTACAFFLDIFGIFPYNLIRILYCHRVVSESACLHIVRS